MNTDIKVMANKETDEIIAKYRKLNYDSLDEECTYSYVCYLIEYYTELDHYHFNLRYFKLHNLIDGLGTDCHMIEYFNDFFSGDKDLMQESKDLGLDDFTWDRVISYKGLVSQGFLDMIKDLQITLKYMVIERAKELLKDELEFLNNSY